MSDALEHEVKIIIDIVSNLRQSTRELDAASEAVGGFDRKTEKAITTVNRQADALEGLARKAKSAEKALASISAANSGHGKDRATDDWVTAQNRLIEEQVKRAKAEAAESNRQMDVRAASESKERLAAERQSADIQEAIAATVARRGRLESQQSAAQASAIHAARERASEEARVTAELQRQAQMRTNATRASAFASPRAGSFLAQDSGAAPRAADTTWARDAARRSEEARKALADYDRQLNSNTVSYRANTSALADMLRQEAQLEAALPRLRYALYDVATTSGLVTTAIAGIGIAATTTFASFESAFTNVERTLDPAYQGVEGIRESLLQMTREMPLSFQQLSQIATLGNQLGVSASDLAEFTDIVAKFSTVSGMTAEASAQAFGRLSNILGIPISQTSNLASAIELVSVNFAATEPEIVALTERLGATATRAGFTADQVVGLAGALGSLKVAPERAQGVFETYFNSLNDAIAGGGEKLSAFASIVGMTESELSAAVASGGGFEVFQKFIAGLQGADTVQLTTALDALGLSGLRANEVISRISQGMPLLQKSFAAAAQGAQQNSELNRQYAFFLDDLATKWQIFINALAEFGAAVGEQIAPAAAQLLEAITSIMQGLADFAGTDTGAWLLRLLATFGALAVVVGGLTTATALAGASMAAFRTVLTQIKGLGLAGMFSTLVGGLGATGTAGTVAATGVSRLRAALLLLSKATVILGVLQVAAQLLFDFGGSMQWVASVASGVWGVIKSVQDAIVGFVRTLANALPILGGIADAMAGFASWFQDAGDANFKGFNDWANSLPSASSGVEDFGSAADAINWDAYADGASNWSGGLGDVGDSAGGAAREIRTLVDYASDLQGVFQRAFDIRFGGEQAFDQITSGWLQIADAADAARQAVEEHQRKLAELAADQQIKQYWLMVAENYGDELRAAKLRSELADISAEMADEQKGLAKEQGKATKTLVGNSEAAIANRSEILGLVGDYQSYLQALAASGVSQAELQARSTQLRAEFVNQAVSMGYSRTEIEKYATAFDDMNAIIDQVPRNITLSVNANPAIQALSEYEAALNRARANAGQGISLGAISNPTNGKEVRRAALEAQIAALDAQMKMYLALGLVPTAVAIASQIGVISTNLRTGNYWTGGYVGDGGKYEPKGVVHGGEFVFSKAATQAIGVNNLNRMHEMAKSGKSPAPVGLGAATGMVELSPYDRSLLVTIADNIGVTIGSPTLQAVTNGANANSAQRRSG